jgi:hypothetical protein
LNPGLDQIALTERNDIYPAATSRRVTADNYFIERDLPMTTTSDVVVFIIPRFETQAVKT